MKRSNLLTFLYIVVLVVFAGLIVLGIENRTTNNRMNETTITPAVSRDLPDLTPQDIDHGSFRVLSELPDSYFLSEAYHKKHFPSSRIWSSVPATGELKGSYFFPFAVKEIDGDFLIDIPRLKVDDRFVLADISADGLRLKTDQKITDVYLKDFSDLAVRFEFRNNDTILYEMVIGQGLPYLYVYPVNAQDFTLRQGRFSLDNDNDLTLSHEENNIVINGINEFDEENRELSFETSEPFTFGFYTDGGRDDIINGFDTVVEEIYADWSLENGEAVTLYSLLNGDGATIAEPIPFGFLPHHGRTGTPLYSLETIRGNQNFYLTDKTIVRFELETITKELLFDVPSEDEELIVKNLKDDIENFEFVKNDSYFGGKELAKAARLIELARIFDEPSLEFMMTERLKDEFELWFNYENGRGEKFFEWDLESGGVIAQRSSFGSDDFNDHHFHYGYFLYASSVVAEENGEFLEKYRDFINVIALDIANTDREFLDFPYIRTFDFYEGHSWAAGHQPFSAGNNQESTSEAINAWYSLWRWGNVSDNDVWRDLGHFLYTTEANSTRYYWLNGIDGFEAFPTGYDHNIASLVWGAKVEYSTFFSPDPRAIEGIQYLPITPGSIYLFDEDRIDRDFEYFEERDLDLSEGPLIDLNVGYYAMNQGWDVLDRDELDDLEIDSGNTRANLYYWISYWDSQE